MPTTVLLLGESGTGKEVVARFGLQSDLFDHEPGAFTGALQSQAGVSNRPPGARCFELTPSDGLA